MDADILFYISTSQYKFSRHIMKLYNTSNIVIKLIIKKNEEKLANAKQNKCCLNISWSLYYYAGVPLQLVFVCLLIKFISIGARLRYAHRRMRDRVI